jgi:hypothetical protein
METDVNYPQQPASLQIPPIADWLDRPEDTPLNLQVTWLTRRFGLSRSQTRRRQKSLGAMKKGAALHLFTNARGRLGALAPGSSSPDVAEAITHNPNVVGVGDSLFGDRATSQTFLLTDQEDNHE